MKLEQTFIEEQGLSAEQVASLESITNEHEAELNKSWEGKANENAEKILEGAASKVEELTGIQREQGQKIAEYFNVAGETYSKSVKASYENKLAELEEKIKSTGDEALVSEHEELKTKYDELLQKDAKFKEYEENDYKGKLQIVTEELTGMKKKIAFNSVKPKFPETANEYEVKAKWNAFVKGIEEKYNIAINEDGDGIAIDKENQYSIKKISELVEKSEELKSLMEGRSYKGLGKDKDKVKIDGLPFTIEKDASPAERNKAIREYLSNELKLSKTSRAYSEKFSEYNKLILEQKTA